VTSTSVVLDILAAQLADTDVAWSVGTFGAIAEFTRDTDEAVAFDRSKDAVSAVTARGGLRIAQSDSPRLIASESLTAQSWNQRVALCLAESDCAMSRHTVLSEIGPDRDALRVEDRNAILFDLGLGALQVDACIRTGDATVIAALRGCAGRSIFDPACGAMGVILAANPHRVFVSRLGRIEVFQPIPPPGGQSPSGPHTHVLPKLLRHGRTHAATEMLPEGWIPCAHFYPPHPLRDGLGVGRPFESERHLAFQLLMARYGDPRLVDIKKRVCEAVASGHGPTNVPIAVDRFARATIRIGLRQLQAEGRNSPALMSWLAAYERLDPDVPNDSVGDHACTA
jgi:hypothetical protein